MFSSAPALTEKSADLHLSSACSPSGLFVQYSLCCELFPPQWFSLWDNRYCRNQGLLVIRTRQAAGRH
uniref:Uncharacterized protein n=1 Tax=Neovison vison TaxID=452646 RepID=A0A8C7BIK9_NEOVI